MLRMMETLLSVIDEGQPVTDLTGLTVFVYFSIFFCLGLYYFSYISYTSLYYVLVQKLVVVWSENSDEKNRVVAFCAIHRLLFLARGSLLQRGFKVHRKYLHVSSLTCMLNFTDVGHPQKCSGLIQVVCQNVGCLMLVVRLMCACSMLYVWS